MGDDRDVASPVGSDEEPDTPELALDAPATSDAVGLSLSGGGYRAMLFHLGGLRRLNETGHLATVNRVASVSGGSIIAGVLGRSWADLDFREQPDGSRVADRFEEFVERPIYDVAGHTIDVRAVLTGLRPGRIARKVEQRYDRYLFHGATLQDLPDDATGPRFIVLATNLSNGTLWRFSRPYMRDWRTEPVPDPTVPLARAVAASSAFPPVLSPAMLELPDGTELTLTDGGVYDNLGLEPIVKRCGTVFVSDGGGTYQESERPRRDWLLGTVRVLNTIDVQVRRLRRRQVVGALEAGLRRGGFWAVNTDPAHLRSAASTLPVSTGQARALAGVGTRLAKMDRATRHRLANWGYAAADAVLRQYVDPDLAEPVGFPYPDGVG